MVYNITLLIHLLLLPFTSPTQVKVKEGMPKIWFEKTTIKLGDIHVGERYERAFIFKNTGDAPLVIDDTETSCGCTVVKYTKEPIMPGATGEIKVDYVPKKGTKGFISKSITIKSNAENGTTYLYLHGTVVSKEKKG